MSREDRAKTLLEVAKSVADGTLPCPDDDEHVDPEELKAANQSIRHVQTQMTYLVEQAQAGWKPAFRKAIGLAHSIRTVDIDPSSKSAKRGSVRCDACGRVESRCNVALDLVGGDRRVFSAADWATCCVPCEAPCPSRWSANPPIATLWEDFCTGLNSTLKLNNPAVDKSKKSLMPLPKQDMGRYHVGKTCLRKAVLTYQCQTYLLDRVYEASFDKSEVPSPEEVVALKDRLELAIADEKRPAPPLNTDAVLWEHVDAWRSRRPTDYVRERKNDWLRADDGEEVTIHDDSSGEEKEEGEDGIEDFIVGSDEEDSEEGGVSEGEEWPRDQPPAQPRKQRSAAARRRVVEDDDVEEAEAEDEPPAASATTGKRPVRARKAGKQRCAPTRRSKRQRNVAPDEELCEPSVIAPAAPAAPAAPNAPVAAGSTLPSKRDTIANLMRIQSTLFARGEDADAAACGAAIFYLSA